MKYLFIILLICSCSKEVGPTPKKSIIVEFNDYGGWYGENPRKRFN